ncbi:hypothetical protein [Acinetobacter sp. YH12239]|uniref:hypothetical protein n=1 Tax=Acinetobacter sp. YH12239 TaxID=2601166 RepID=UPI0015D44813|nr:hypothetical protein [Acinetobacter sp. YH12239]
MQHSLGTEAIRAYFTLQCCWLNNEEVYLEKGCIHCGSAATYLIYFTNHHIQNLMLDFIAQYSCSSSIRFDFLDLQHFEAKYNDFLQHLEKEVNFYARQHHAIERQMCFEQVDSIFERHYSRAC